MELGMNPAEVEALGNRMKACAEELRTLSGELTGRVDTTTWRGPDANRFKTQWWPDHRGRLLQVATDLDGFGQSALNNASDQRRISDAATGGAGGVSWGDGANLRWGVDTPSENIQELTGLEESERADWFAELSDAERAAVIAENPELIGNLDGVPLDIRFEANELTLENALAEAQASGNQERVEMLERLLADDRGPFLLLDLDAPGGGRIAEVHGDLETAHNVVVVVPGIGNDLGTFSSGGDLLVEGAQNIAGRGGDHTAVVAWLDYDPPRGLSASDLPDPSVLSEDRAREGAQSLSRFLDTHTSGAQNVSVVAHSYGSTTAGIAASEGLPTVDNLILVGSPGGGADSVAEYNLAPGADVYASKTPLDPVPIIADERGISIDVNGILPGGDVDIVGYDPLGKDPTASDFGATVLDPGGIPPTSHGDYLREGELLDSIVNIVVDTPPGQTDLDYGNFA